LKKRIKGKGEFNIIKKDGNEKKETATRTYSYVQGLRRGFHLFNMPPWYSTTEEEDSEDDEIKPSILMKPTISRIKKKNDTIVKKEDKMENRREKKKPGSVRFDPKFICEDNESMNEEEEESEFETKFRKKKGKDNKCNNEQQNVTLNKPALKRNKRRAKENTDMKHEKESQKERNIRSKHDLNIKKKSKENTKKSSRHAKTNSEDMQNLDIELLRKVSSNDLRIRYSKGRKGIKRKMKKANVYNAMSIFLKATRFKFDNILKERIKGKGEFSVIKREKDYYDSKETKDGVDKTTIVSGKKRGFYLFNMPPWYSTTEEDESEEEEEEEEDAICETYKPISTTKRKKRRDITHQKERKQVRKKKNSNGKFRPKLIGDDTDSTDESEEDTNEEDEHEEFLPTGRQQRKRRAKRETVEEEPYVDDDEDEYLSEEYFVEDDVEESVEEDDDDEDFENELMNTLEKGRGRSCRKRRVKNKKFTKQIEDKVFEEQLEDFNFESLKEEEGEEEEEEEEDDEEEESGLSCIKCNEFKKEDDRIYVCKNCNFGWHQYCSIPPVYHKPKKNWLCPLCSHISLVQNFEQTLEELDILLEKAEERRLTAFIENQSHIEDSDDSLDDMRTPKVHISVQNFPPEIRDYKRKRYFEYSSSSSSSSSEYTDEDDQLPCKTPSCTCKDEELCLFCKKLQGQLINQYIQSNFFYSISKSKGCTCENKGTCRSCMAKIKEEDNDSIEEPRSLPKMSTTELFLLTGKARQVEVTPHERYPDDGFRFRGTARGRGATRRPRRPRGGRGVMVGVGRGLPPGITVLDSSGTQVNNSSMTIKARGRGANPRSQMRKRGGTAINGIRRPAIVQPPLKNIVQNQIKPTIMQPSKPMMRGMSPRGRGIMSQRPQFIRGQRPVRPALSSRGRSMRRGGFQRQPTIDIIDIDIDDDEPPQQVITPQSRSVVPYRGQKQQFQVRPKIQGQQLIHRPIQNSMQLRPRMPVSRGSIMPVQNPRQFALPHRGQMQRPPSRQVNQNMATLPYQRGIQLPVQKGIALVQNGVSVQRGVNGNRRVSMQRGVSVQRGVPIHRGNTPIRRGISPQQRGNYPVAVRRGSVPVQRGAYPSYAVQSNAYPQQKGVPFVRRGAFAAPRAIVHRPTYSTNTGAISVKRGFNVTQRGAIPVQRGYSPSPRRGLVPQRQMMGNQRRPMLSAQPRAPAVPVQMRQRLPVIRPQQRGMLRGHQPMGRARTIVRGKRMPVSQPFNRSNSSYENDNIIIPTLNPGNKSGPDFDIIAEDEIKHIERDDDNIMSSSNSSGERNEEAANLARLPGYIQIQKVVEHEVLDID